MKKLHVFLLILLFSLALTCIVGSIIFLRREKSRRFTPYVIINPYAYRDYYHIPADENTTLEKMLSISKNLGFKGIGIYGLEGWMAENRLPLILALIDNYGFDIIIYINWLDITKNVTDSSCWNQTGFPYNQTQVSAFLHYVGNISLIAKDFACVKAYVLQYPYWQNESLDEWKEFVVDSIEYKQNLQKIINRIHAIDPEREIYLSSDMLERWFGSDFEESSKLPYDFANITGFGFSCYYEPDKDKCAKGYIKKLEYYYEFFREKSKEYASGKVVFSEWGFKTNPYAKTSEGLVKNEEEKAEMIKEVLTHVKSWDCPVCYFMLHDFPKENADWGIITSNLTLKPSAYAFEEILNPDENSSAQDYMNMLYILDQVRGKMRLPLNSYKLFSKYAIMV